MARTVTVDGVDRSDATRHPGSVVTSSAFNGEVGTGQLVVDDVDAALAFPSLKVVRWTEDASGGTKHLYRGRVIRKALDRGGDRADDARQFTLDISDSNWDLRRLRVHQWSRPAETGRARVVALGAYILNGASSTVTNASYRTTTEIDVTTYAPNTNTNLMDAKVYDATDPWSVIDDCARAEGKVFFVFTDDDGDQFLWYDVGTSTSYASTLSITDDDPNLTTEFAPAPDGSPGEEDGSELLSGGALVPAGGLLSIVADTRPAVVTDHDVAEETFYDSGANSDAMARLGVFLDEREDEEFRYRCYIDIPADQAHLIKAGMTISFRWAAAGVTSPIVQRVVRCGVELWEPDWYRLHLELGFPEKLAARIRDIGKGQIQSGATVGSCVDTFSRIINPGAWGTGEWGKTWNINLAIGMGSGTPALAREAWSVNGSEGYFDAGQVVGAPADTGTSAVVIGTWSTPARLEMAGKFYDHGYYALLYESLWLICGSPVFDDAYKIVMYWTFGSVKLLYFVSPNNPDSDHAHFQAWVGEGSFAGTYDIGDDPGAGWTLVNEWDVDASDESGVYCPGGAMDPTAIDPDLRTDSPPSAWGGNIVVGDDYYQARAWGPSNAGADFVTVTSVTPTAPDSISYHPTKTSEPPETIFAIGVDEVRTNGNCLPNNGGDVFDLGLGDGSTTTYTVPTSPYRPGTLQVWVDGLDQTTAITETDPTAGTFTFSFTPGTTERITVYYQEDT